MTKQTPFLFNFSTMSNTKSTASKKPLFNPYSTTQNKNVPPFNSQQYTKKKRNFNELESAMIHNLPEVASSNMRLSFPKIPSVFNDNNVMKKQPLTMKVNLPKVQGSEKRQVEEDCR